MPLPTPPPLPATCSVEALADWLADLEPDSCERDIDATARAVRAVLEAKVREAVFHCPTPVPYESVNAILSRVLGAAK